MDYFLLTTAITLLITAIIAGWAHTLMGLPSNWPMVTAAALYAWLTPTSAPTQITWKTPLWR